MAVHDTLGTYQVAYDFEGAAPERLYTDNETNATRLFGAPNAGPYVKDAFHNAVIGGRRDGLNPEAHGTQAALHYQLSIAGHAAVTVRLRLSSAAGHSPTPFGVPFDDLFRQRIDEADQFFAARIEASLDVERARIARTAYAGLLWSKQFYNLVQSRWSGGDPAQVAPPAEHASRNADWLHLYARDVLSV